jgi:hypothetical protein
MHSGRWTLEALAEPIQSIQCLRKLVGKVICKQLAPETYFRAQFCPDIQTEEGKTSALHQVGVAVKGGADMKHSIRAHLECHPEWSCVSINCTNAWVLRPAAMMAAVRAPFSQLLAFTQLGYNPLPCFFEWAGVTVSTAQARAPSWKTRVGTAPSPPHRSPQWVGLAPSPPHHSPQRVRSAPSPSLRSVCGASALTPSSLTLVCEASTLNSSSLTSLRVWGQRTPSPP